MCVGKYKDVAGNTPCTDCPSGTVNPRKGATASSTCGSRDALTSNGGSCTGSICTCNAGWASIDDGTNCQQCLPGTYKETAENGPCAQCPAGSYNPTTMSTTSANCSKWQQVVFSDCKFDAQGLDSWSGFHCLLHSTIFLPETASGFSTSTPISVTSSVPGAFSEGAEGVREPAHDFPYSPPPTYVVEDRPLCYATHQVVEENYPQYTQYAELGPLVIIETYPQYTQYTET